MAWNRRLVASQLTQGVLLGESIPKMAERVRRVTDSNYATAVRAARTAVTGAENAGRVASYKRAQGMGIDVGQEWLATLDGRTRHSHRQLDGERVEAGGTFSNGCRYPGDPEAAYAETMNCRCTLVPVVAGIDQSDAYRWSRLPEGVTYEQWKAGADRRAVMEAGRNDPPKGAVSFSPKYEVDERAVSSKAYAANVRRIFGDKAAGGAIASARRILRHRGGSNGEDLYAIDLETGRVVSSVVTSGMASRVDPTGKFLDRIARAQARGARIATLHNHPASGMPSASDLAALDLSGSEFGAIACHDGSFYVYRRVSEPIEGYNIRDEKRFLTVAGLWGDDEASLFRAIEERYGVRIEHIR